MPNLGNCRKDNKNGKMTLCVCVQKTILFGVGGVLMIVGTFMAILWPFIFDNVLKSVSIFFLSL